MSRENTLSTAQINTARMMEAIRTSTELLISCFCVGQETL